MTDTAPPLPTKDDRIEALRRDPITRHGYLDRITDIETIRHATHLLEAGFQAATRLHGHDVMVAIGDEDCADCKAHQDSYGGENRCAKAEEWWQQIRRAQGAL